MIVTAEELKANLDHYLDRAELEDVLITKNGRVRAKLSSVHTNAPEAVTSLFGVLPNTVTKNDARAAKAEDKGWLL